MYKFQPSFLIFFPLLRQFCLLHKSWCSCLFYAEECDPQAKMESVALLVSVGFSARIKSCLEQKEAQKEAAGQPRVLCSCVSFVLAGNTSSERGSWIMGTHGIFSLLWNAGENASHDLSL